MAHRTRTTKRTDTQNPLRAPVNASDACDLSLTDLLERITTGDETAFGDFYDQTSSKVYGLALRILGEPMTAEEVTMDVYLQIWQHAHQFDQTKGKPEAWLTVLTRSRAIDRLRLNKKFDGGQIVSEHGIEDVETGNPEQENVQLERCRIVRQGLVALPKEQREVIVLGYFKGLTQNEIAQTTGQPLGTVKTRVRLAMSRLRDSLEKLADEFH